MVSAGGGNADMDASVESGLNLKPQSARRSGFAPVLTGLAALILLAALLAPGKPGDWTAMAIPYGPIDVALLVALTALAQVRFGVLFRVAGGLLIAALVVIKIADIGAYLALARPFNPVIDAYLLGSVMNLLTGAIGVQGAFAAAAGAVLAVLTIVALVIWAVGRAGRMIPARWRLAVAAFALGLWGTLVVGAGPGPNVLLAKAHIETAIASIGDIDAFRAEAAMDAFRDKPADALLGRLKGKDVAVIFVESYGRTVLDNLEFAPFVRPVLEAGTRVLATAGLSVRSAFLTSPTVGGLSWLAHGTAMSGLWIDNQRRYDTLVTSDRFTLNQAFQRAGWHTVAVMPAITTAWPEGAFFGYDSIYGAGDLGYRGKPFNWVTMPDQYTLSAFDRLERPAGPRKSVMAEIALISSHAPWTPIPKPVDWLAVGDGTIFNDQATAGDPPDVVWRDPARVRTQFRLSIDYAMGNLVSYALANAGRDMVLIVLGDHQPAPLVTGPTGDRGVPVHIIASDPAVLAAIDDWGWTEGLVPAPDAPVWRMDALRDKILTAFSD